MSEQDVPIDPEEEVSIALADVPKLIDGLREEIAALRAQLAMVTLQRDEARRTAERIDADLEAAEQRVAALEPVIAKIQSVPEDIVMAAVEASSALVTLAFGEVRAVRAAPHAPGAGELRRAVVERMRAMDVAQNGNTGWEGRALWFLNTLRRLSAEAATRATPGGPTDA